MEHSTILPCDTNPAIGTTADIVTAYLGRNSLKADELPGLISSVHSAVVAMEGAPPSPIETRPEPAVSIRASVKPDAITCLECGQKAKMLKRHIESAHGLTPEQYRARWGLPADYPMTAPNYSERRRDLAVKIGLGRKGKG